MLSYYKIVVNYGSIYEPGFKPLPFVILFDLSFSSSSTINPAYGVQLLRSPCTCVITMAKKAEQFASPEKWIENNFKIHLSISTYLSPFLYNETVGKVSNTATSKILIYKT